MEADSHTFFLLNCAKFISAKNILNKGTGKGKGIGRTLEDLTVDMGNLLAGVERRADLWSVHIEVLMES